MVGRRQVSHAGVRTSRRIRGRRLPLVRRANAIAGLSADCGVLRFEVFVVFCRGCVGDAN